jgi:quinol monooxygenase YgiN
MILVVTRMKVRSEKRLEFSQTIASLTGFIRMETGCRRCDFCRSTEDEDHLFLLEEWDTREHLITHMQSDNASVFRGGAQNLLQEPYERKFHTVFRSAQTEEISKVEPVQDHPVAK